MFRELSRQSRTSGSLELPAMEEILNSHIFGVFSCITENGYPMTVPVHYVYDNGCIYIHSANQGEKVDSIAKNQKVSFMVSTKRDPREEKPFTIYDTVLIYGTASILDPAADEEARSFLRKLAVNCDQPGKADDRYINGRLGRYVVIKVAVDHMSGRFLNVH